MKHYLARPQFKAKVKQTCQLDGIAGRPKIQDLLGCLTAAYAYEYDEEWMEGYQELLEFAKEHNCERVTAYTDVPRMLDINKHLGGYAKLFITSPPLMNFSSEEKKEE